MRAILGLELDEVKAAMAKGELQVVEEAPAAELTPAAEPAPGQLIAPVPLLSVGPAEPSVPLALPGDRDARTKKELNRHG